MLYECIVKIQVCILIRLIFQKVFHPIVMNQGRNYGIFSIETKPMQSIGRNLPPPPPLIKIGLTYLQSLAVHWSSQYTPTRTHNEWTKLLTHETTIFGLMIVKSDL
jgi:hypothetical protein